MPPIPPPAEIRAAPSRSTEEMITLNERLYSVQFPRSWGYYYGRDKSALVLVSPEKNQLQKTSVAMQIYTVPESHTAPQLVQALGKMNQQRFPKKTFGRDTITIAGTATTRLTVHSVLYKGRGTARFRHMDIVSPSKQWVLAVSVFQPSDHHEKDVLRILNAINLKNRSKTEERSLLKDSLLKNKKSEFGSMRNGYPARFLTSGRECKGHRAASYVGGWCAKGTTYDAASF